MKRVLLLGAGYANLSLLTRLGGADLDAAQWTLISRENYHYKSICLHDVASGKHGESVKFPLSRLNKKIRIVQAEVAEILPQKVRTSAGDFDFDYLVVGLGFESDDFGVAGVRENALAIEHFAGAQGVAAAVRGAVDEFARTGDAAAVSFAICGGGFTGIEFAGSLAQEVQKLCHERGLDGSGVRIYCIEMMPKILTMYSEKLQRAGLAKLAQLGVEVVLGAKILECKKTGVVVEINGAVSEIPARLVVWTAGVKGSSVMARSKMFHAARNRVVVDEFLRPVELDLTAGGGADAGESVGAGESAAQNGGESAPNSNLGAAGAKNTADTGENANKNVSAGENAAQNIFVVGDCSAVINPATNRPFPPTAQLAREQGRFLAAHLRRLLRAQNATAANPANSASGANLAAANPANSANSAQGANGENPANPAQNAIATNFANAANSANFPPFSFTPKGSLCSVGSGFALASLGVVEFGGWWAAKIKGAVETLWDLQLRGISL